MNWAILNGEDHIGATLHHMVAGPDAGDIVDQKRVPIGERDTSAEVMARVVNAAVEVLDRQLDALLSGTAPRHPQDAARASYFTGRKPEDGRIDWNWSSRRIFNLIRAVTRPFPGRIRGHARWPAIGGLVGGNACGARSRGNDIENRAAGHRNGRWVAGDHRFRVGSTIGSQT